MFSLSVTCTWRALIRLSVCLFAGVLTLTAVHGAPKSSGAPQQASSSIPRCPASFLMDAVVDRQGALWAASENQGLWRLVPGGSWQQMNKTPGFPGDSPNIYALAVDGQGRVWAGTAHEGVAVWNGREWKVYNRLNGLAGDRVFDIQVSPETGDVAVATSGGLSIYSPAEKNWTAVSRAEGLAENQIESLAFMAGGALVAGYQCGGVGISTPESGWKKWNNTQSPWHWDEGRRMHQPGEMYGTGLPSNLCNAVAAAGTRHVWAATSCGLAWLRDGKWLYTRGKDAAAKNKGIYGGLPTVFRKTGFPSEIGKPDVLPEDYVTALLPCREGLWVGFRKEGAALVDPAGMKVIKRSLDRQRNGRAKWVRSFVVLPGGDVYACTNGGGLQKVGETAKYRIQAPAASTPPHPREAPVERIRNAAAVKEGGNSPATGVVYVGEDWATRGDWCGHYGQDQALLCAVNAPLSNTYFSTRYPDWRQPGAVTKGEKILEVDIRGYMGPHKRKKDFLRAWCHRPSWPENRNVLYCPEVGTRTEAEWDDHGEAYESTFDGPNVWVVTDIPEGLHEVALYFYSPNGREGNNGYRDFLLEARTWKPKYPGLVNFLIQGNRMRFLQGKEPPQGAWGRNMDKRKEEIFDQQGKPVEARTRVKDFAGNGVYKRFLVKGPVSCGFTVRRNASFNTIVNGVFVTRLDGKYDTLPILASRDPYIPSVNGLSAGDDLPMDVLSLWSGAFTDYLPSPSRWDRGERDRLRAYRSMRKHLMPRAENVQHRELLRVWQFSLKLWDGELRNAFDRACIRSWNELQERSVIYRSREWRPNSPNVLPLSREELSQMAARGIDWKQYLPGSASPPQMSLEELKRFLKEAPHQQPENNDEE